MMSAEDQEILTALKAGGEIAKQAFNELIKVYHRKLYMVVRRILPSHADADDALQNTLFKVWKNAPNFRGDSALFSWMYRIAVNEALRFFEKTTKYNLLTCT